MKFKLLATALTVSMPLLLGNAYAQSTTTPDSGNNRSASGDATTTNQTPSAPPASSSSGSVTGGSTESSTTTPSEGATGGGAADSGVAPSGTADGADTPSTTPGTGTMGSGTPDSSTTMPAAPGMESQGDSAATTEAITGWSAKDDIIGKSVFNENDEKIGDVNDVVIAADGRTMYLLIGAGGFLGMGSKNVAVPFDRFKRNEDRILLSGYTKEQLKALPEVRTQR